MSFDNPLFVAEALHENVLIRSLCLLCSSCRVIWHSLMPAFRVCEPVCGSHSYTMSVSFPEEEVCNMCRGKQIKDIAWFMIVMSVLLFFIGAGTHLNLVLSRIFLWRIACCLMPNHVNKMPPKSLRWPTPLPGRPCSKT